MKEIIAYTDGSAVASGQNKGKGGYGVYFPNFYGKPRAFKGRANDTKTGRMELTALLYAIKMFYVNHETKTHLIVYSDSQYVTKSFTERRLHKWIENGWRNSSGEVANRDLWEKIIFELKARETYLTLEMRWIKAHQLDKWKDPRKREQLLSNPHIVGNAMADKLADYKT